MSGYIHMACAVVCVVGLTFLFVRTAETELAPVGFSVFLKANGRHEVNIAGREFNLTAMTLGRENTASNLGISNFGNGWAWVRFLGSEADIRDVRFDLRRIHWSGDAAVWGLVVERLDKPAVVDFMNIDRLDFMSADYRDAGAVP